MKFITNFWYKLSNKEGRKAIADDEDTQSSNSVSRKANRSTEATSSVATSSPSPPDTKARNIKTAKRLMALYESKELSPQTLSALFVCDVKKRYKFEDGMNMTTIKMAEVLLHMRESFPNMKFPYESIKAERSNRIVIEGVRVNGTHTGKAFSFAPGIPEIPTSGIHCVQGEERIWLDFDENGKIETHQVIALEGSTGPVGLYEQIGGVLTP